jgi:hypothetical protein
LLVINATGFQDDYDDTSNPGIFNEFIGAAMRMGHSMIPPHQAYLMPGYCLMDWYTTIETFKSSHILYAHGGANLTEYARCSSPASDMLGEGVSLNVPYASQLQ